MELRAPGGNSGTPSPAVAEDGAPDVYADGLNIGLGPYGVTLSYQLSDPTDATKRRWVAHVRMSPQLAATQVQLLRKVLKNAQADGLGLAIPKAMREELELGEDL